MIFMLVKQRCYHKTLDLNKKLITWFSENVAELWPKQIYVQNRPIEHQP